MIEGMEVNRNQAALKRDFANVFTEKTDSAN